MENLKTEGKIVMCKVTSITEYSYECNLLENWGLPLIGELQFTQLTRKKRLKVKPEKILSIGKILPLRIIDNDNVISLSKIQIDNEEIKECEDRYNKYKQLDNIMHGISYKYDKKLDEIYNNFVYPFFSNEDEDEKPLLDIYVESINNNKYDTLFESNIDKDIAEKIREELINKIIKKTYKLSQEIKLKCFTIEGINVIKKALLNSKKDDINMYLDTPPSYILTYETQDIENGKKYLEENVKNIEKYMKDNGGIIEISDIKIM